VVVNPTCSPLLRLPLLGGRFGGDYFGPGECPAGIALFTVASLVCGFRHSQWLLSPRAPGAGHAARWSRRSRLSLIVDLFHQMGIERNDGRLRVRHTAAGGSIGVLAGGLLTRHSACTGCSSSTSRRLAVYALWPHSRCAEAGKAAGRLDCRRSLTVNRVLDRRVYTAIVQRNLPAPRQPWCASSRSC